MLTDQGAITAIIIFGATQTGALIFFAGIVATQLRNHDRRLDKVEDLQIELLKAFQA
jgi:hypothetical protein